MSRGVATFAPMGFAFKSMGEIFVQLTIPEEFPALLCRVTVSFGWGRLGLTLDIAPEGELCEIFLEQCDAFS